MSGSVDEMTDNDSCPERLPIVILAGSDRRPGPVPLELTEEDMIRGPKGAVELPSGRSLAAELVRQMRLSECFEEPILLGPGDAYEAIVDCEVIDVRGNLAATMEALRSLLYERFRPEQPVVVCAIDVLPSASEFRRLLTRQYAPHATAHFWWQLVRAEPNQMGASEWKPSYQLASEGHESPNRLYPGHLVIIRPGALRLRLIIHVLSVCYQHRNRSLSRRWPSMIARGVWRLLLEDARNLIRLKAPVLTATVLFYPLWGLVLYRFGRLSVNRFADYLGRLIVHREHRRATASPALVVAVTEILSFAKDFDTREELTELIRALEDRDLAHHCVGS